MRNPLALPLCLALLACTTLAGNVSAQQQPTPEPASVLVLGTYHFANPGLDVVQTEVADVLTPAKQAEIRQVVDALARFRPTKVAVEALPESAARLDSLYAAYRVGRHELSRNETYQLGFRLAARFEHPRVHPIDHGGEFPFGPVMQYAQTHDPAFVAHVQAMLAEITAEENRRQRELSVGQNLRQSNEPARIAADHALYLQFARVGAGDGYAGAELLSKWYERNIRIFANLQRIAEPGDRILVIIGSGHSAILRELIESASDMELVEALDFLPPG
jgi:hypothetical protein